MITESGSTGLTINPYIVECTEIPDGVPLLKCSMHFVVCSVHSTFAGCDARKVIIQIGHFVLQGREIRIYTVSKVTDMVSPTSFKFKTLVVHFTGIHRSLVGIHLRHRIDVDQQVFGVFVIVVQTDCQAVIQETHVKTKVQLLGFLPLEIRIGKSGRIRTIILFRTVSILIPGCIVADRCSIGVVIKHIHITVNTPGSTKLHE